MEGLRFFGKPHPRLLYGVPPNLRPSTSANPCRCSVCAWSNKHPRLPPHHRASGREGACFCSGPQPMPPSPSSFFSPRPKPRPTSVLPPGPFFYGGRKAPASFFLYIRKEPELAESGPNWPKPALFGLFGDIRGWGSGWSGFGVKKPGSEIEKRGARAPRGLAGHG